MTAAKALRELASKLGNATKSIADEIARARKSIDSKREEIARVRSAPLPMAEIEARAKELVRKAGDSWLDHQGGKGLLLGGDRGIATYAPRLYPAVPFDGAPPWGAVCAGDPDYAVSFLVALAERVVTEPGLPAAERPAVLARLEAELAELEATEESLIDEASLLGVTIAHRPEVTQRRQNEARRRELEEQRVQDRRRRQEELDRAHASRRTGPSQYLAEGKIGP